MKQRIQRKIENLREQPAHIRNRAAIKFTATVGIGLAAIWLFALLPLQLRWNRPNEPTSDSVLQNIVQEVRETNPLGQVGGIQDPATTPASGGIYPNPNIFVTESTPSPTPSPSPTPQ